MKITKTRLKQLIKEEMIVLREDRFTRDWEEIKRRLMQDWEENDQQTAETFINPDELTAAVLEDYRYEWEDLDRIVDDAVEDYNKVHEDEINIENDVVYDILYRKR
ncbi:MAG: hypothetical protein GOVbin630_66 [Prokaryotic dsDNA virus sp.]|nr:MAG: hypothetical protein GOVbin630_66 [Prokaryotic dsDNA virus sp.]|tara:strand:- start:6924 stop:7241 length:318 start_codon:yes stop_codon:yes gene_type:complete